MYMIDGAFITLRDSIDIVKDYNIIVRGFVCYGTLGIPCVGLQWFSRLII